MDTAEIWLERFREVVALEIERCGKASAGYRAVSEKTGIDYDYLYQIYTGKPKEKPKRPTLSVMEKIEAAYGNQQNTALAKQKFEGSPVMAIEGTDPLPLGMIYIRESQVRFSAGNGRTPVFDEIQESVPRSYTSDWFVKEGMNPENCRRFKVDGDSMEPFLYDNDKVLVNLAETTVINGKVYALRYGEELRIKRVYRKIDGGLILHSDNPDFRPQDEEISPEIVSQHISIIGRVRDKSGTGGL